MKIFKNLRARLLFLVLIAVIPALAITLYSGLEQRRLAHQQAVDDAYRYTRLVVDYERSLVESTHQLFLSLSLASDITSEDNCAGYLGRVANLYPNIAAIFVERADGKIFCSVGNTGLMTVDRKNLQPSVSDPYFLIGQPVMVGASSAVILPLSFSVPEKDGQPGFLITTILDLSFLQSYASSLDLPERSALLLVSQDGTILMRYPEGEMYTGQWMPNVPIVEQILNKLGEGDAEAEGVDGVLRLYAFTPLVPNLALSAHISIGIPVDVAYAAANRLLFTSLFWIGIAALLAILAAWFGGDIFFLRIVSLTAERDAAEQKLREANGLLEARVAERTAELARVNAELGMELAERKRMVETLRKREVELQRLLRLLERSNRDLQDFAYITSHDLQEPLRKIQAFGERLVKRNKNGLGEEGSMFVERMIMSANRMQAMINDLLAYSRITTKGQPFERVSLSSIAHEVVEDLDLRIHDTGGSVQVGDLPEIDGDALQLRQLLQNLIVNALKFHRPGVPPLVNVTGRVEQPDGDAGTVRVVLCVEDNGIGFDEKYAARIFGPFQRLHSKDDYEGSGIGLAICQKIVDRHGGEIAAHSIPDQGSHFIITLPVNQTYTPEGEGI
jgi:signal transduction histidine kinase